MNNTPKPYDDTLYATQTSTLRKIADREGATSKIAQVTATVFSVAGELITSEREAYIIAIEFNRRKKGGAKK
jgi:hypothetical protein